MHTKRDAGMMDCFFDPKGVALIGATSKPRKGGYRILKNLMTGFQGKVYPVNPAYKEIEGLTCYRSVLDVPGPVDLAIVFLPAPAVPQAVRECAARGIRGVIIQSAGFAETGDEGKALQEELKRIGRETGVRLWGPNCMGLVDGVRRHVFSFVMENIWDHGFTAGNVSLIVQSGFLAAGFLVDVMSHGTMGISKACSIGNKVDVDECDLLEYMITDPQTAAIGLYLESISDGRRFMDLCRASGKPIVVLKGGTTAAGAKAALSHTASLAGHGALVRGALAQAGVVEAHDFYQMMDMCRALAKFPNLPEKRRSRVAIVTGSGGAGIIASDLVEQMGLELADLSPATRDALSALYPEWMPVANPVDLYPAIERRGPRAYLEALRAVCADPNVDAVLFHIVAVGFLTEAFSPLAKVVHNAGKPAFGWLMGLRDVVTNMQKEAAEQGIPVFRELSRTVECLAVVLNRPRAAELAAPQVSQPEGMGLRGELDTVLRTAGGTLDEHASKQILGAYGIPVVDETVVSSGDEAARAAAALGFPAVMKGLQPGKIHKTELGLVRLGIASAPGAAAEFEDLRGAMQGQGTILVQRQIRGELELIVGLVRDPQFGPCVMLGFGGVMAEVLGEPVFAVAPLTEKEALRLIDRVKPQKLLEGFRGAPSVDREGLARILAQVGDLGCAYPRVREVDINPLIVSQGKCVAVDASVILDDVR
jgi:acyl-CoA synthetase (NDP forming)